MRDKNNYESNIEYAICGVTEPYTNKIVHIDLYVYDWNEEEYYPRKEDIIKEIIDTMKCEDNVYWRDLKNMFNYHVDHADYNKVLTGIVVLESYYEVDKEPNYISKRLNYWREVFKPRYDVGLKEEE